MTARERVVASIEHRQPDRTPWHITFTEPARRAMQRWYGDPGFEAGLGNCLHVIRTRAPEVEVPGRPGTWADEFGVHWDRTIDTDIGTVCNRVVTRDNLERVPFPDPADPVHLAHFPAALAARGDRFTVATIGFTLFERAWTLAGMEEVLMAMAGDAGFASALLDRILDLQVELTRRVLAFDIDGMRFGDDWGHQGGIIMGPALWREFIKPRVARLYGLVKAAGKRVFIHSCGKVDDLFPDLVEIGVDVFNPFQPEVMDVAEMKRRHGGRMTFFGGISTQKTLPCATPDRVKEEVRRLLAVVGRDGGYIAAPAHDIPKDARPENIAAMIEALQGQGG